ncbi:MAG TPA: ferritin family protein [Candidatus Limiplasma sp.]|nr:ferritin family protein [Candidatus Limiplasma sp.]HPS81273.1 ferritin family protein [Candidatus Limiplasma sp.]
MEILQYAITMEEDGEKYYREQAARNADNPLRVVFEALADDEARHASLIRSKADGVPFQLEAANSLSGKQNLFSIAKDFHSSVEELPNQLEAYHAALDKEQQSIDLYQGLLDKAEDDVSRGLFSFLVQEEKHHLEILDELFQHLNRPNNWVESAEFGVREEY